jgi:hypothetical protein
MRSTLQQTGVDKIAIHASDHFQLYLFRTRRFTLADVRAAPELFRIKLPHHPERTLMPLGLPLWEQSQMSDLGARE